MAEKKVDYNDILCQAIDTIVSRKIESLDYDKTIVCKIVDDSDAPNGHYVVNDGSISFDAYSEDTSYKTDESVYVTVPKGDFTQTKIIISKYTADNSQDPISYVSPLEQVYLVSDNLVTTDLINNSILANGRMIKVSGNSLTPPGFRRLIWEQDLTNSTDVSVQNNAVFDTIALKAKFKCGLGTSYRMKAGHYGIIVQIYSKPNNDSDAVQMTHYDLSTDEMFGNPYMFLSYISQQKKIDISNLGSILKINVYLYQSNDFLYRGDSDIEDTRVPTPLNYTYDGEEKEINITNLGEQDDSFNNIFVDDLEIYFGMDLTKVSDNTFTIYCNSGSTFSMTKAQSNTSYNNKTIMPVWFNKTEDGEYLGYSDGVYDFVDSETEPVGKAYTEDLYLQEAKRFERGAQISQMELIERGIPVVYELLQTYALGQDAKNILNKIYRKISVDISKDYQKLVSDLRQYQSASQKRITQTLYEDSEQGVIRNNGAYATCISNLTNWMADESNENSFVKKVEDILLRFGAAYTSGTAQTVSYSVNALTNISGNTGLTKNLADLKSEGTSYFTNVKVQTDSEIEAVWDVWKKSFDNDIKECEDLLANLKKIINAGSSAEPGDDVVHTLSAVQTKFTNGNFDDYEEEHNEFLEAWSKRYCIYWYRYQESYFDENEQFMPRGWQRLTTYTNAGLPDGYTIGDDYNKYYEIRPVDPRVTISVGDASVKQEQIQAILIYDHQIYKSNILNFYNEDPVIDEETSDANKGLYIQLTDEVLKDDGTVDKPDTYNSKETYQLYGITNYLVNQAERYTRRKLRARYKGINKGDEYLRNDCVIYWYVPLNSTMLDVNHAELVAAGFSVYDPNYVRGQADVQAAIDAINRSSMTQAQYTQAIQNIKDNFIGTHYPVPPAPYKNNYIEGYLMAYKDIQNDSDENFENSTMFTYQIKNYYVPTFTNNTIRCRVVKKRTYVYDAEQYFTFASYGTSGTDYSLSIVPATNVVAVRDNKALALKIGLYDHNGDLMETETSQITVSLKDTSYNGNQAQAPVIVGGTAPDIQAARLRPTAEYGWAVLKANASITIHYDENGKAIREDVKQTNNANGTSSISTGTNPVAEQTHPDRTINLESYYPIPWSSGDYYIEGASTIVYDSLGSNPSYYPDPYVLYHMSGSQQNKPVANQRWAMKYYPVANSKKTSLVSSYLPAMKQTNGDYCLQVPNMYLDDNNYVACAVCYIGTSTTPAWVQPILIIKNRFSSPMMNDWDGSLTLDEKNGTILSSMVGAGKKENDNTFSGVLMGDVSATSEDAATGLGLYGYNHGEQSFGFKNDGTAFIGKAGKGRIKFDGNHGEIASSSYADAETEAERTGMMVDLDDGYIDMRGAYVIEDQTQAWKAANGQGQSQNNNEINGYDNTTKYKASGSQVLISSTSPFVTIKSPEILYYPDAYRQAGFNTGTELRDAYRRFWDSVEYYKYDKGASESKSAIRTYLQEVYDIHNATYYTSTSITVGSAPDTFLNNVNEQKSYGYFRVSANLKLSNLTGTTFWSKLSSKPSYTSGTENVIIAAGDYVYCYMYSVGGNIDINSENFRIQYIPAQQAVILNVMAYPSVVPAYVNGSKETLTKVYVEPYTASTGVGTEYTLSGQINDLRDLIYNAITTMRNLTASLNDSQFNSYECVKFLQPDDYATAKRLYCQSNKPSNTILKVGMDEYYMQTDNYQKGTAAQNYANGAGLKFDLMKGSLDAYNFTLFAADPKEGSSIKLSSNGNPFFKIAYKGTGRNPNVTDAITLIEISKSKWLMQSQNWYNSGDMTGRTGTQFDLSQGKITSYNFDLRAYNNTTQYGGSYIMMSSTGNPFFRIHLVDNAYSFKIKVNGESDGGYTTINTTVDKNLINITTSHFVLQSKDYGTQYTIDLPNNQTGKLYRGVQWDLNNSKFTMYSGKIELKGFAVNGEVDDSGVAITEVNDLGFMRLSSDDTDTPFNINNKFKIYWDGSFMAEAGKIGGWRVNNTSLWSGGTDENGLPTDSSFRLSSSGFNRKIVTSKNTWDLKDNSVKMAVSTKLAITRDGTLYAKGAQLDDITANAATFDNATITNATITNSKIGAWTLNASGELYAGSTYLRSNGYISGGYIDGGEIHIGGSNFIVNSSGNVTIAGDITVTGVSTMTMAAGSTISIGEGCTLDGSGIQCKRILVNAYGGGTSHFLTYNEYEFTNYFCTVSSGNAPSSGFKMGHDWVASYDGVTLGDLTYTDWIKCKQVGDDYYFYYGYRPRTGSLTGGTTFSHYVCTGAKVKIRGLIYPDDSYYDDPA